MPDQNYFDKFPQVDYRFGNNELPVKFQDLTIYIDALDQLKEYGAFYENYNIQNGERPDHVSYKLYENTEYYWTFFLLNDKLREQGWPISNSLLYGTAQSYYPNVCITTNGTVFNFGLGATGENIPMIRATNFQVGNYLWFEQDKVVAKILRIDHDLALIHLDIQEIPEQSASVKAIDTFSALEIQKNPDFSPLEIFERASIVEKYNQWDAPHHYEDINGDWIYPTYDNRPPHAFDWTSVTTQQSVSYFQRFREENDELRSISVLRQDVILDVVKTYNKLVQLKFNR